MSASARLVLRSLIGPVYAPTLAQAVGMMATLPVIPLIALALGFSVPAAAALTLITGVVGVLGPIPLGALMTALGERRAMIVTGVAVTCTQIGTLVMVEHARITGPTHWHQAGLVASLVVSSLSREVWIIGRQAYLGTALPPELRARGMSTFGGMMRIGQVIGPLLGAGIIALGHEGWVIGLDAVAMAAATLMVALTMLPGEHAAKRPTMRQAVGRIPVAPSPQAPDRTAGVTMVLAGFATVPLTMSRISRPLIFPLLGAMLGLRGDEISLIFAIAAVVELGMFVPAGTLMDRHGRAAVLVPCLIFSGAGYVLLVVLVRDNPRGFADRGLLGPCSVGGPGGIRERVRGRHRDDAGHRPVARGPPDPASGQVEHRQRHGLAAGARHRGAGDGGVADRGGRGRDRGSVLGGSGVGVVADASDHARASRRTCSSNSASISGFRR